MNPKNEYVPAPVDTRAVEIPRELAELAEMLSKNTHEVWARTRLEQEENAKKQRKICVYRKKVVILQAGKYINDITL